MTAPATTLLFLIIMHLPVHSQMQFTSTFKAAVYEHKLIAPPNSRKAVSRQVALHVMKQNLNVYKANGILAALKGANILVFPEDGLYGFEFSRETIAPYLEFIPDPKHEPWNPCTEPLRYEDTEVQTLLSCMAKETSLYIVANIGNRQPCNKSEDTKCPEDGQYQYNTNVVYDPRGLFISRYHKVNLYFEKQFNYPRTVELEYFDTPFGRFGSFICFDILFHDPSITLIEQHGVGNVVFPTAWNDGLPLQSAIGYHSAWAMAMGVNLLSANMNIIKYDLHGSGIFTPNGSVSYYYNSLWPGKGKLLVSEIDVILKPKRLVVPKNSSDYTPHKNEFQSVLFNDLFNFVPVIESSGVLEVCHNKLCCKLTYSMTKQNKDLYAFGAFDGLHDYQGKYYQQSCALVRCSNASKERCGTPTKEAFTHFTRLQISGTFSTTYVFPEVLLLNNKGSLLLAHGEFSYNEQGLVSPQGFTKPLVVAGLYGRVYSHDESSANRSRPSGVAMFLIVTLAIVHLPY